MRMKNQFTLTSDTIPDLALRAIEESDCENLRIWKNRHRHAFFYQKIILPEEQIRWFRAYLSRPDDFMFIVTAPSDVGCMGFRLLEEKIDVYNVIRGVPGAGRRGLMKEATHLMCAYALSMYACEVGCKVLIDNPAVEWYEKCGFVRRAERETYFEMVLNEDLSRISFQVERRRSCVKQDRSGES